MNSNLSSGGVQHLAKDWQSLYDGIVPRAGDLYILADKLSYNISLASSSDNCNGTTRLKYTLPNNTSKDWWETSPTDMHNISISISVKLDSGGMTLLCSDASLPIYRRVVTPIANDTQDVTWPESQLVRLGKRKAWNTVSNTNASWPYKNFGSSKAYSAPLPPLSSVATIRIALPFMVVVIICNACKIAVILWMIHTSFEDRIVTQGDAIAFFLEQSESSTEEFCTADKLELLEQLKTHRRQVPKPWRIYRHPQGRNVRARWRSNLFV